MSYIPATYSVQFQDIHVFTSDFKLLDFNQTMDEILQGSFSPLRGQSLCKDIIVFKDYLGRLKSDNGTFIKFIIKWHSFEPRAWEQPI